MVTARDSRHVRTMRNVKGRHSCPASTGVSTPHVERARIALAGEALIAREARRLWLSEAANRVAPTARRQNRRGPEGNKSVKTSKGKRGGTR